MENPTIIPGLAGAPSTQGLLTQLLDSLAPDEVRQLSMLAEEHFAPGADAGALPDGEGDGDANAGAVDGGEPEELSAEDQKAAEEEASAASAEQAKTQATEAQSMVEEMRGFADKAKELRDDAEDANDAEPEDGAVERTTIDIDVFDEKLAMFDAMIDEAEEAADECETAADKENYEECGTAHAAVSAKFAAAEELLRDLTEAVHGDGNDQAYEAEVAANAPESPLTAWVQTYKG